MLLATMGLCLGARGIRGVDSDRRDDNESHDGGWMVKPDQMQTVQIDFKENNSMSFSV